MYKKIRHRINLNNQDGFSLMEIMLVFAIMAILSSMSMPAMRGFAASRRLHTSARAIVDTLSFARDMAITERTTHLVVFDITGNRFWLASSETFDVQDPLTSAGRAPTPPAIPGNQVVVSRTGGVMGIPQQLQKSVTFAGLVTNTNGTSQQVITGADYIYFTPTSKAKETEVLLQNTNGNVVSISVEAATGRVSMLKMTPEQAQSMGFGGG